LSKDPRQTFGTGAEMGPDVVQLLEVRGKFERTSNIVYAKYKVESVQL
jgi:hypothetical protein